MISYANLFKSLLTTGGYITTTTLKQYITSGKMDEVKDASLEKEISRKWKRFVKVGLLNKVYNGTDTVYTLSDFTKELHRKHGTAKLMSAYRIIELVNDNEFDIILENLSLIMNNDDNSPTIGFHTFSQHTPIDPLRFFFKIISL